MTKDNNLSLVIESPTSSVTPPKEQYISSEDDDSKLKTLENSSWSSDRSEEFPIESKSGVCLSTDDSVKALSSGLLSVYEKDLKKIEKTLMELTTTQKILIETIQQENVKFNEIRNQYFLDEILNKTKQYHSKLIQIKKDMTMLHDRSTKLRKRSLRLQEYKQKEALQRELQKEKQAERDRQILAKVSTSIAERPGSLATLS